MKDFGAECRDVRFREVGVMHFSMLFLINMPVLHAAQIHEIHHKVRPESIELLRRDYSANGGWETFLSYEDPERDILVGLLRLRKCSEEGTFRPELVQKSGAEGGTSIVRELHVYGTAVPVHGRDPTKFQHQVCERFSRSRFTLLRYTTERALERFLWRKRSALPGRNMGASNLLSFLVSSATRVSKPLFAHILPRCGYARLLSKIRVQTGWSLYE